MSSGHRKLGRYTSARKAMLRNLTTNLLYHGKIKTTEARAKEVRKMADSLIALAAKEYDKYTEVTVMAKVPEVDAKGKRVREEVNGKRVVVYKEVEKTIQKDSPERLKARRKINSVLYPVTLPPKDGRKVQRKREKVDMAKLMFDEIGPKYADRQGGYTRIVKLGQRRGDGAPEVIIELV